MQLISASGAWHPQLLSTFEGRMFPRILPPPTWALTLWWFVTFLLFTEIVTVKCLGFRVFTMEVSEFFACFVLVVLKA